MNNAALCHWLLPWVITTLLWNTDLINGCMKKVNLLRANCTLCLGNTQRAVWVFARDVQTHTYTLYNAHKHTCYCSH